MKHIQLNALQVASLVFGGVLLLCTLFFQFLPGKYQVPVHMAASSEFYSLSQPPLLQTIQLQTISPLIVLHSQAKTIKLGEQVSIIPVNRLFDKKVLKKLRKKEHFIVAEHPEIAQAAAFLLQQCGIHARPICLKPGSSSLLEPSIITIEHIAEPEKMKFNYRNFIKQTDAKPQFKVDKRNEVLQRSGC